MRCNVDEARGAASDFLESGCHLRAVDVTNSYLCNALICHWIHTPGWSQQSVYVDTGAKCLLMLRLLAVCDMKLDIGMYVWISNLPLCEREDDLQVLCSPA
jgi:hypothetical protein